MRQDAPAVWACVRAEWRARWRGLVAVALLAGVAAGVTFGAIAGARRSATAFDRFSRATRDPNLEVTLGEDAPPPDPARLEEVGRLPGVIAAGQGGVMVLAPANGGLRVGLDTIAGGLVAAVGGGVNIPIADEGRRFNPARVDEVMLNPTMAERIGARPGDRITLVSLTPAAMQRMETTGRVPTPDGPRVDVTVVGIGRIAEDVSDAPEPAFGVTPAFMRRYADEVASFTGMVGVFADPDRIAEVRRGLARIYGPDAVVDTTLDLERRIDEGIRVQVVALWAFAAVAAAAGALATAQALSRQAHAFGVEHSIRSSLGMTNRQLLSAGVLLAAPAIVVSAVLAITLAIAGSSLLPAGLAGQAEPDPGVAVDPLVLGAGTVALVAVLAGCAAASAWSTIVAGDERAALRPSSVTAFARRAGLSPAALIGVRHALEPGRGATAVPVRSSLLGAVAGVAGVAGVLTFVAGVGHLFDTPRLWGAAHDAEMEVGSDPTEIDEAVRALAADRSIRSVTVSYEIDGTSTSTDLGRVLLDVRALEARKGTASVAVAAGRAPRGGREVAVGGAHLADLGIGVGDELRLDGPRGPVPLRVVGEAITPGVDEVDSSVVVMADALPSLTAEPGGARLLVALVPGADPAAARQRHPELRFHAEPPSIVDNLDELGAVPEALAGFLAALAAGAALHGLVTAVRRRRRDLGVLRALGFTRGQVAAAVRWQSLTIAAVGLAAGLPAGVIAGRQVYAFVARSIGVVVEPVTPLAAVGLIVPVTLAFALAAAAYPGRAAAGLRPAVVLRAE
jgi:hypothetical protein